MKKQTFGLRLRVAREKRGITQQDLTRASGVTQAGISKIERNEQHSASYSFMVRLANALDCDPGWLCGDIGDNESLIEADTGVAQYRVVSDIRRGNVRSLIDRECGGVRRTFCDLVGRNESYVNQLVGINPNKNVGDAFARHVESCFELPVGWLDADHQCSQAKTDGVISIDLIGEDGVYSADSLRLDGNRGSPYVLLLAAVADDGYRADSLLAVEVKGSSMEPALCDGDKLLAASGVNAPQHGHCYLIETGGALMVRRLKKLGGEWWVTADNSLYSKYDFHLADARIVGHVIEKISRHI